MRKDTWSEEELEVLRDSYLDYKINDIQKLLPGRTAGAIYAKMKELGLRKKNSPAAAVVASKAVEVSCAATADESSAPPLQEIPPVDTERQALHRELERAILVDAVRRIGANGGVDNNGKSAGDLTAIREDLKVIRQDIARLTDLVVRLTTEL